MNGTMNADAGLADLVVTLDVVEHVPDDVVLEVVTRDGSCMALRRADQEPDWSSDDLTDRETAARICAGCSVRHECLEFQLRTSGNATLGVWGALPAEDVRALFPLWRSRRRRRDRPAGRCCAAGGEQA